MTRANGISGPAVDGLVDLFLGLTRIPSPSLHERGVADLITDRLGRVGLEVHEDTAGEALGGDSGNLYVLVPGQTPEPVLLFGAHMDTVLPAAELVPVLEEGVFRNRADTILGADNKTAVAALVHATETLLASGRPFPTYELVFTISEEQGLLGAKHLPPERLRAPQGVMFDSTGDLGGIVTRAPTHQTVHATFRGKAAHAGLEPEKGRSAIFAAARAVSEMRLGRLDEQTTANVGVIHGGTATNIVPDLCEVRAEWRSTEEARVSAVAGEMLQALQKGAAAAGVDLQTRIVTEYRSFSLSSRSAIVRLSKAALTAAGRAPRLHASGGGSDANVLNERGIPTVNLSCGMKDVHTPEETLALCDLEDLVTVIFNLLSLSSAQVQT